MLVYILSYVGGILTILSPCVLPVIPFIFSRADQSFRKKGLPMLVGMGISFAGFASLSVTGGHWIIEANRYGRYVALAVFFIVGLTLLSQRVAEKLSSPFVRLGNALQQKAGAGEGIGSSLLLGSAVGLLWAPCAGPILGLVLAGSAVSGSNAKTFQLLFVFAMGAATSLGVVILGSGKVLRFLKKGFGTEEVIRKGLGVAVLLAVVAIGFGLDTKILARISYFNTNKIEQGLVDRISPRNIMMVGHTAAKDEGAVPSLSGAVSWINSEPLTTDSLKGKVVLIDFWTYSCINCLRTLPYVKMWAEKYKDQGLVVIGVHTPEFAFEKDIGNVKKAIADLGIQYPVAVDSKQVIWDAFQNQYWPAHYFIDAKGRIRGHHFGEGSYDESEKMIQQLLLEAYVKDKPLQKNASVSLSEGSGVQAAATVDHEQSPETYLGYDRQEGFLSTPIIREDVVQKYREPKKFMLNHWGVKGEWKIKNEVIELHSNTGEIAYQFHARDLHLVLGSDDQQQIRFRVTLDGKAPGENHGTDTDANGYGVVKEHRLYQLVRLKDTPSNRTFKIEFLDSHVQAYAFTFG